MFQKRGNFQIVCNFTNWNLDNMVLNHQLTHQAKGMCEKIWDHFGNLMKNKTQMCK